MSENYRLYAVGATANMHDVTFAIERVLLAAFAVLTTWPCFYLLMLTLLSADLPLVGRSSRKTRFDIIVPAHNESAGIGRTVTNLARLDWPRDQFRILVVADNCTDSTAEAAAAAGADVLVRNDPARRGKGYALAHAFEHSRSAGFADALVVVDADSEASRGLLDAFAARLERGAHALQGHYDVLNPHANWRTRLMAIALGSIHTVRSRARERLGVSCGIRGNGWCVTHALLREVEYASFSLTEDIEFGIALGLCGHRVVYCEEARVDGEMVTGERAARSQRQRWEGGRFKLIRSEAGKLLVAAIRGPSLVCLDLALDLLVLPLSYLALGVLTSVIAGALAWHFLQQPGCLWLALAGSAALVAYVLRGWKLSNVGKRGLVDLIRAPGFILWKCLLLLRGRRSQQWVRTDREGP